MLVSVWGQVYPRIVLRLVVDGEQLLVVAAHLVAVVVSWLCKRFPTSVVRVVDRRGVVTCRRVIHLVLEVSHVFVCPRLEEGRYVIPPEL